MNPMHLSYEIKQLWDKLETSGVMRASLFNLIVVCSSSERVTYLKQITHKVIERFPCRLIFITIEESTRLNEIKAHVTATSKEEQTSVIACDVIYLHVPQTKVEQIPLLILPHFLPDLPIYLLWAQDPCKEAPLLHELQKWASRTIYDSEVTDNLSSFCKSIFKESQLKGKMVADLNWARLENWRELLAATFYSPLRLASLQKAIRIHFHYNTFETPFFCHTKIQALYLQAWLSTCLGWKFVKGSKDSWEYENCTIFFHPEENSDLPPGAIVSVDISCSDSSHFSFHRDPLLWNHVRSVICDEEKCEIPSRYIFSKTQSGLSLVNQIYHTEDSPHFLNVIQFLSSKEPQCLS